MNTHNSTATPVPSRREILINGAAVAVAAALSTVPFAASNRAAASAFPNPNANPDKGGHFAAWEQPQILTTELRAAFRSLR